MARFELIRFVDDWLCLEGLLEGRRRGQIIEEVVPGERSVREGTRRERKRKRRKRFSIEICHLLFLVFSTAQNKSVS